MNHNQETSASKALLPPPKMEYVSREELMSVVQSFARAQGYAVSIKRSNTGKRVFLKCDSGGLYQPKINLEERKRESSTRRIDCSFLLSGKFSPKTNVWRLAIEHRQHNHGPSLHPSGHSIHRRLTAGNLRKVNHDISRY
ncbi:putative methylmalonate-semialdehyde dehydrogenase [Plasmopara halstedii]